MCRLCVSMVKLSPVVLKILKLPENTAAYMSEDSCWWFVDSTTAPLLCQALGVQCDADGDAVYECRKMVWESGIMGDRIGVPKIPPPQAAPEDLPTIRHKGLSVFLEHPPQL